MPRELTGHKVNELNEALTIEVLDEPGQGGACQDYVIRVSLGNGVTRNDAIQFHNGPIAEVGVTGISNEALLVIVEDRLKGFQSGPFACPENEEALVRVRDALFWLNRRTKKRIKRGQCDGCGTTKDLKLFWNEGPVFLCGPCADYAFDNQLFDARTP